MKEAINIVVNFKVTQETWDYLKEKENYSEYLRELIQNEMILEVQRETHEPKKFGELLQETGYSGLALAHIQRYNKYVKFGCRDEVKFQRTYELARLEMKRQQQRNQ